MSEAVITELQQTLFNESPRCEHCRETIEKIEDSSVVANVQGSARSILVHTSCMGESIGRLASRMIRSRGRIL